MLELLQRQQNRRGKKRVSNLDTELFKLIAFPGRAGGPGSNLRKRSSYTWDGQHFHPGEHSGRNRPLRWAGNGPRAVEKWMRFCKRSQEAARRNLTACSGTGCHRSRVCSSPPAPLRLSTDAGVASSLPLSPVLRLSVPVRQRLPASPGDCNRWRLFCPAEPWQRKDSPAHPRLAARPRVASLRAAPQFEHEGRGRRGRKKPNPMTSKYRDV